MSKESFRRELRTESERWWREGLIDADLYQQLAVRYQFADIEAATGNRFISIVIGLGGILLGLGAITLVAANWQDWSRSLRVIIIFSAFLAVNGTGFYLWRRPKAQAGFQRLGLGLLLTGALIMGANLGLMSQLFHQSGPISSLYLVWGLGVLVMAYALRLTPLGVLSFILIGISYQQAMFAGWWRPSYDADWLMRLQTYLPLLITPLYLPLVHWCRSRVLYGFWVVNAVGMSLFAGTALVHWNALTLTYTVMLLATVPWVYRRRFWRWPSDHLAVRVSARSHLSPRLGADGTEAVRPDFFQPIGRSLAIWFVTIGAYACSFRGLWRYDDGSVVANSSLARSFVLSLVVLSAIALYGLWQSYIRRQQPTTSKSLWMTTPIYFVVVTLIGLSTALAFRGLGEAWMLGVVLVNGILFFVGSAMVHDGLMMGIRHRFWGGMATVVIGLMSRMFEYDTELLLKAIVLALCGIAVIAAGLWFEKKTKSSIKTA